MDGGFGWVFSWAPSQSEATLVPSWCQPKCFHGVHTHIYFRWFVLLRCNCRCICSTQRKTLSVICISLQKQEVTDISGERNQNKTGRMLWYAEWIWSIPSTVDHHLAQWKRVPTMRVVSWSQDSGGVGVQFIQLIPAIVSKLHCQACHQNELAEEEVMNRFWNCFGRFSL